MMLSSFFQFIFSFALYFYTLHEMGWSDTSSQLFVFMIIASGSYAFLILLLGNLSHNKLLKAAVIFFCSLFLFSNIVHYRYFKEPILLGSIYSIKQIPFVLNYVIKLLMPKDLLFLGMAIGSISVFILSKPRMAYKKPLTTLLCLCFVFIVFRFAGGYVHYYQAEPGTFKAVLKRSLLNSWDRSNAVRIFGFLPHLAYEAFRLSNFRNDFAVDPPYISELPPDMRKPDIFLIQVESLPSEIIDKKFSGIEATPFLNSLRQQNCFFSNINPSHTAGGGTSDADFAVLTSREPPGNLPAYYARGLNKIQSLPRILSAEGYTTVAYHANRGGFWGRAKGFKSLGFEQFISKDSFPSPPDEIGILPDEAFFNYAFEHLQTLKEPLFAFFITMSSHGPYDKIHYIPGENLEEIEMVNDPELKNYLKEIRYVDRTLSVFVEKVEKRYPDHLIVIFGDHPPALEALNLVGNEQIPVFVLSSGKPCSFHSEVAGSQFDIPVSILDYLGLPAPSSWQGVNLFPDRLQK